jgi:hypothetical protein
MRIARITVGKLIAKVNHRNRYSTDPPDVRKGWNELAKEVLMDKAVFNGFRFLNENEVPSGQLPGVYSNGKKTRATDDSRIEFDMEFLGMRE